MPPGSLIHVLHEANPISLQCVGRGRGIVCFKIEMEVPAPIHKLYSGVFLIHELQKTDLTPRPYTCVEILVLELERQSDLGGVETNSSGQVRGPLLRNCIRYRLFRPIVNAPYQPRRAVRAVGCMRKLA